MKLGIVITLIGIAWCARCYLTRPKPLELPITSRQYQSIVFSGNVYLPLPDSPREGETIEYTYWSVPDPPDPPDQVYTVNGTPWHYSGGTKHSHTRQILTFVDGKWAVTEHYPKRDLK